REDPGRGGVGEGSRDRSAPPPGGGPGAAARAEASRPRAPGEEQAQSGAPSWGGPEAGLHRPSRAGGAGEGRDPRIGSRRERVGPAVRRTVPGGLPIWDEGAV